MNFIDGSPRREFVRGDKTHEMTCLIDSLLGLVFKYSNPAEPTFIAVGGYTAMGKSTLSQGLAQLLIDSSVVPVDSFMLNREQRKQRGISGDNPEATNFEAMQKAIAALRQGSTITLQEYNHASGLHDKSTIIAPSRFIIVEGTTALYPQVSNPFQLRIFLDSDVETRKQLIGQTEKESRGYTEKEAELNWTAFYEHEQYSLIGPTKANADIVILVNTQRKYTSKIIEQCVC